MRDGYERHLPRTRAALETNARTGGAARTRSCVRGKASHVALRGVGRSYAPVDRASRPAFMATSPRDRGRCWSWSSRRRSIPRLPTVCGRAPIPPDSKRVRARAERRSTLIAPLDAGGNRPKRKPFSRRIAIASLCCRSICTKTRTPAGFYCYEYGGGDIGRAVVAALDAAAFRSIPSKRRSTRRARSTKQLRTRARPYYGRPLCRGAGVGRPLVFAGARAQRGAARLTYETPSRAAWESRTAMHRTAVLAAVAAVSQGLGKVTRETTRE